MFSNFFNIDDYLATQLLNNYHGDGNFFIFRRSSLPNSMMLSLRVQKNIEHYVLELQPNQHCSGDVTNSEISVSLLQNLTSYLCTQYDASLLTIEENRLASNNLQLRLKPVRELPTNKISVQQTSANTIPSKNLKTAPEIPMRAMRISELKADILLKNCVPGTFLLRQDEESADIQYLSFKTDSTQVRHIPLRAKKTGTYEVKELELKGKMFRSIYKERKLEEIIDTYNCNSLYCFKFNSSLKDLCLQVVVKNINQKDFLELKRQGLPEDFLTLIEAKLKVQNELDEQLLDKIIAANIAEAEQLVLQGANISKNWAVDEVPARLTKYYPANSVLTYAIRHLGYPVVKWLVENGANLEAADLSGSTPLSHSISHCYIASIELLLKNNASPFSHQNLAWKVLINSSNTYLSEQDIKKIIVLFVQHKDFIKELEAVQSILKENSDNKIAQQALEIIANDPKVQKAEACLNEYKQNTVTGALNVPSSIAVPISFFLSRKDAGQLARTCKTAWHSAKASLKRV